jgi:uncharacterized protein DUF4424
MLKSFTVALAAALAGVAAVPFACVNTWANDSTAELATGGLVFVRNDNVEMRSEDLTISTKEVQVRYRFFNKSDKPVTVLVAFPMPEITVDGPDDNIALPTDDPVNLLAFATTVNGRPVATKVEQRVFAAGLDRTQLLRDLGVPLAPHLKATSEALDKLPRAKWDELIRFGVAEIEQYDVGKGMQDHLGPRWSLQTTFYWEQIFPPKVETVVEHRYKPSVGTSVQTALGSPDAAKEDWYEDYVEKYCLDKEFLTAVERARREAKGQYGAPYSEQRVEYILSTGANWAGPIKEFRLVVDKGEADNLVSFCGDDVKKVSPTRFEMKMTDFTPEDDFAVLILKKLPKQ